MWLKLLFFGEIIQARVKKFMLVLFYFAWQTNWRSSNFLIRKFLLLSIRKHEWEWCRLNLSESTYPAAMCDCCKFMLIRDENSFDIFIFLEYKFTHISTKIFLQMELLNSHCDLKISKSIWIFRGPFYCLLKHLPQKIYYYKLSSLLCIKIRFLESY